MTVKLRLMRVGKKKQPTYRIVAADSRSPRDGRFIEIVGTYMPRSEPSEINVKDDKAMKWLSRGAQPTETVRKLLQISGVWDTFEGSRAQKPAPKPRVRQRSARAGAAPASKTGKASASKAGSAPRTASPVSEADEPEVPEPAAATGSGPVGTEESADAESAAGEEA